MMNMVDFAILAVIGVSVVISFIRGFIKEAFSLTIWGSAYFFASYYYLSLASFFTQIESDTLRKSLAFLALFVVVLLIGAIVNYVIAKLVEKTGLSGTDRFLGVIFGGVRSILILSAVLFFIDMFTSIPNSQWWQDSLLIPYFRLVIEPLFEHLESMSSFLSDSL